MTFMTNDQWAVRKGYDDMAQYTSEHDLPSASTLTAHREMAHGLLIEVIGGTPEAGHENYLLGAEFSLVNLSLDYMVFKRTTAETFALSQKRIIEPIDIPILVNLPEATDNTASFGWGT